MPCHKLRNSLKALPACARTLEDVCLRYEGEEDVPVDIQSVVDHRWATHRRLWPDSYDGALPKLTDVKAVGSAAIELSIQATRYSRYIASRTQAIIRGDVEYDANPLGMTCIVISQDDRFLIGRRSEHAEQNPGRLYVVGGYPELHQDVAAGIDLKLELFRELEEEIDLKKTETTLVKVLGLEYDKTFLHPEIFFSVQASLKAEQLLHRSTAHQNAEFSAFKICSFDELIAVCETDIASWSLRCAVRLLSETKAVKIDRAT